MARELGQRRRNPGFLPET